MGTDYFELRKPITHLSLEKRGGHYRISIWINHGLSGVLIIREDELDDTMDLFTSEKVVYHGYYGSGQKEIIEKIHETNNLVVISEYGNIIEAEKLEGKINNARY